MNLTKPKILMVSGVVALVVAGTGTALAATSGPVSSAGAIGGCYSARAVHGSRTLILQDQGTACPAGTKALSWNQSGQQGPAGVSGLQIETCNTGQLFGFQAPGAGTLNPLCSVLPSSNAKAAELDCPQGKAAISASWGGWDGTYGSSGQGLSPLTSGAPYNSSALASPTTTDNGYQFIMPPGGVPPMLYVTCANAS